MGRDARFARRRVRPIAHRTPVWKEPLTRCAPAAFCAGEPAVQLLAAGPRARRFPAPACGRQAAVRRGRAHSTRLHGTRRVRWAAAHIKDGPVLPHALQPPRILQHSLDGLPVLPSLVSVAVGVEEHDAGTQHGIRGRGRRGKWFRPRDASETRVLALGGRRVQEAEDRRRAGATMQTCCCSHARWVVTLNVCKHSRLRTSSTSCPTARMGRPATVLRARAGAETQEAALQEEVRRWVVEGQMTKTRLPTPLQTPEALRSLAWSPAMRMEAGLE